MPKLRVFDNERSSLELIRSDSALNRECLREICYV